MLSHWNNSPQIDPSPHSDTLSWFLANQSLLFFLNAASLEEEQQIPFKFIVFGFTPSVLESMIYYIRGEHANHYTTDSAIEVDLYIL